MLNARLNIRASTVILTGATSISGTSPTMKLIAVVFLAITALAYGRPEPPVPSYSTTQQDAFAPPLSNTYGAPSDLSATYGAPSGPSSTYGVPSNTYGAPSNTYGAPSAPSSSHGAPGAISNVYGTPGLGSGSRSSSKSAFGSSRQFGSGKARLGASPSRNYGVPPQTSAIFKPSSTYGAPSSTYGAPSPTYGAPGFGGYGASGYNKNQDDLSEPAMYQFSYNVLDDYSGNDFGHREGREGDVAWGSYEVLLPDGRKQIVDYEADQTGFRPKIRYEQTGYPASKNSGGPY